MADSLNCADCPVRASAACAALSPEKRRALSKIGRKRAFRRGETVLSAGSSDNICATLVSGALKITSVSTDGDERILSLVHPAGFVGELFASAPHHDIVAISDSELCVFSRSQYEKIVEDEPALALALLRRSEADLYEARAMLDISGRKSANARVAEIIQAFASAASHSPCHAASHFDLPLKRGELAALLGLTIETVSRQLGRLERDGIIKREGARGISIADPERLAGLCS